jgi:hypothetical protein
MTKAQLAELERVFAHDCRATGYPAPRRNNRAVRKLIADGLLVEVERRDPMPPLGVLTFKGLALTAVGHLTYCTACADARRAT